MADPTTDRRHAARAQMHHLWHPPVLDPTNPIQPGYYPDLHQYLIAVNLANFMGATMYARGRCGRRCDRRPAATGVARAAQRSELFTAAHGAHRRTEQMPRQRSTENLYRQSI